MTDHKLSPEAVDKIAWKFQEDHKETIDKVFKFEEDIAIEMLKSGNLEASKRYRELGDKTHEEITKEIKEISEKDAWAYTTIVGGVKAVMKERYKRIRDKLPNDELKQLHDKIYNN